MNLPPRRKDEFVAMTPKAWQLSARTRIYCANILYQNYETTLASKEHRLHDGMHIFYTNMSWSDFTMLYGLAVENLVKGILIASGIEPFEQNKRNPIRYELNSKIDTHDLNKLFERAKVKHTQEDKELLNVLHDLVENGKYPVAKKWENQEHFLERHPYVTRHSPEAIRQHILKILTMLEDELRRVANRFPGVDNAIDLSSLGLKDNKIF